ncbi:sensor histidine kinase [Alicyclobacillus fodiniaquatilis]|uniref:histidine kinase n=1 Tax=Alicyclobacillus fodiniaquatilis TaxID=1661150 RepID=A0ABW4JE82_9BACL
MSRQSLKSRLIWWTIIWGGVILMVYTFVYMTTFQDRNFQSFKRVLQLEIENLVGQGVNNLANNEMTTDWQRYVEVTDSAIYLTDNQGTELFEVKSPLFNRVKMSDMINNLAKEQIPPPGKDITTVFWRYPYKWHDKDGSHQVVAATRYVKFLNGTTGELTLFSLTDSLRHQMWQTLRLLLAIDFVILGLFALGMHRLIVRGLRPLGKLMEGIQAVEWKQSERLTLNRLPAELASLQQSINHLLAKIDTGVQEQNRFIADASHELRTPLAIINGHANLLRRWGNKNERVWEPAVRNIVSEVERLQRLVDHLLWMARTEDASAPSVPGMTSTELEMLFNQIRDDVVILRPMLQLDYMVHLTKDTRAYIDKDDLHQILLILIDNAQRHTPDGGRIELMATGDEMAVRFTVSDNGEGIPQDVLPHVFDRFYRADDGRGRGKGSGLGLSISKKIVEIYEGKIYVHSRVNKGTTVVILIPMQRRLQDGIAAETDTRQKGAADSAGQRNTRLDAEAHSSDNQ